MTCHEIHPWIWAAYVLGCSSQSWAPAEKALSGTNPGYLQSVSVPQELNNFPEPVSTDISGSLGLLCSVFSKNKFLKLPVISLNCSHLCDSYVKCVAHNCLRKWLFLLVSLWWPHIPAAWVCILWCVPPADGRDTRFHPARGQDRGALPSPGVFSTGEICCLSLQRNACDSVCQGTLVQTSVAVTQPRSLLSSSSS